MSSKPNSKQVNEMFDDSCSLLKESIIDIVLKSSDKHFKIHSLAKLDLNNDRQDFLEQKLNFLFDCLRPKYLNSNSISNLDLFDDADFNLLEKNYKKPKSNLNDNFFSLDVEFKIKKNLEELDSDFITKNDLDDFENLKDDYARNELDDFNNLDSNDFF